VPGVDAPQPLTRWEKAALLALLALFLWLVLANGFRCP
jgi:hypothetical protein